MLRLASQGTVVRGAEIVEEVRFAELEPYLSANRGRFPHFALLTLGSMQVLTGRSPVAKPAVDHPRRIAMVVDCLNAGGAERIAVEVACALDPSRFSPFVVVTRHAGPLAATLDEAGIEYTVLDRRRGFSPRKYWRAHRSLRTADLIHSHKYGSNMWGALLARTTRKPLVAREPTFSGVRERRRTHGYRRWVAPVAGRIICPSTIVAQSLYDEGVPPTMVEVVPNGVRIDAALPRSAARRELGLEADDFVVGIIAQLRIEKAHEVLLRAAARLQGRELKVCVVGDGSRMPFLRETATELALDQTVVWAGEHRDAGRLAAAFDIGVICSDWEGLPVASLEILAAGVPLVATAVGALPGIVRDDAGVIVDVRDDAALAAGIAALMDDPERLAALGEQGRRRMRDDYSFERMVREFERIYLEVLGVAVPGAGLGGRVAVGRSSDGG
jgi:glycosyltransferase involved in cell wall biosynthesis